MDTRRIKRLRIRLLRRDIESSYEAQWTLLKRVRRDKTRGLFKSEPIHLLLHRIVLVMLPVLLY
ncbi:MAG: hypothetical protein F7C34_03970, partial [Desulfurococcales archaeon]|nr:hypothetical protein [Desulfurococcales archaeon]